MANVYWNKQIQRWVVQKVVDGKSHHYGAFKSYDDAEEFKDYCVEHNWDFRCKLNSVGDNTPRKRIAHMFGLAVEDIPSR